MLAKAPAGSRGMDCTGHSLPIPKLSTDSERICTDRPVRARLRMPDPLSSRPMALSQAQGQAGGRAERAGERHRALYSALCLQYSWLLRMQYYTRTATAKTDTVWFRVHGYILGLRRRASGAARSDIRAAIIFVVGVNKF